MNSKASDVEAAAGGGGEEQFQHTHIVNQCSLDPLRYVSWIVHDYPNQLSAAPLLYNELLKSDGALICPQRWKKVIGDLFGDNRWKELKAKTPHLIKVCQTFHMVSRIMAAQMISCTLGLSSLKEWLKFKECDEYKYNSQTHKKAAIYFCKAIERILHGSIFNSSTDTVLTAACTSKIPKHSRVASIKQGVAVTGCSYDCLMDTENRHHPLIETIAKALTGREVEDNRRNNFVNSFIESTIGERLVGPWTNILEQHQEHLWNLFKDLAFHSEFIKEYLNADGLRTIDGKKLEEHSKWGHLNLLHCSMPLNGCVYLKVNQLVETPKKLKGSLTLRRLPALRRRGRPLLKMYPRRRRRKRRRRRTESLREQELWKTHPHLQRRSRRSSYLLTKLL